MNRQNIPLALLGAFMLMLLLAGIITPLIKTTHVEDAPARTPVAAPVAAPMEEPVMEALKAWPLMPPPARVWEPTPMRIPRTPYGVHPKEVLRVLVESHPTELVRTQLNNGIASGEVMLAEPFGKNIKASFMLIDTELITHSEKEITGDSVTALGVQLSQLTRHLSADDVLIWWLVLYHESIHWQQYLASDESGREGFKLQEVGARMTSNQCVEMLTRELQAYNAECTLAREWGRPELALDNMCLYDEGEERNHYIFNALVATYKELSPECLVTWAGAVRHPQPELFAQQ